MAVIIDGRKVSKQIKEQVKKEVENLNENNLKVGLAVVLVGDDSASKVYVSRKNKTCKSLGINSYEYILPKDTKEEELLELIDKLNCDNDVDGILVQLPLPKHIDEKKVLSRISPKKDVDAFHPENVGKIVRGDGEILPCTPAGIIKLLKEYNIQIEGKECVVIGRSNIVGKPISLLLLKENGTVTICHSKTKNIKEITKKADILIVATGKAKMVTDEYVKEGAVVIDVGVNRLDDGTLCGDVDFDKVSKKVSFITPVPGGVGPMTIAMLMSNVVLLKKMHSDFLGC